MYDLPLAEIIYDFYDKLKSATRATIKKLRKEIARHLFEIPIQAAVGGRIIARETIAALRKDKLAKCYGSDVSRKRGTCSPEGSFPLVFRRVLAALGQPPPPAFLPGSLPRRRRASKRGAAAAGSRARILPRPL